jgi:hypothetical protein
MQYYAVSLNKDKSNLLKHNFLDEYGRPHAGILFYSKKSKAVECCDEMNDLRKGMKLDQIYSVCKVDNKEWKEYPQIVDVKEPKYDAPERNVQLNKKRKSLSSGSNGPKEDPGSLERDPNEGQGSTQTLPF